MKTFVLAGDYSQFKKYFPEKDKDIVYLRSIEQLFGHKNFTIKRVGTWKWLDRNFLFRVNQEEALNGIGGLYGSPTPPIVTGKQKITI